jgi:eukaryotic-like serine/threonine-protein kinase
VEATKPDPGYGQIDDREAFVEPDGDGNGTCTVRVAYRTHAGLYKQKVVELLQVTVKEPGSEGPALCRPATSLARSAAAALPK